MITLKDLKGYNNYMTNIPHVIESTLHQIHLTFENGIDESSFTSAMLVYLSRINQSAGIVFKVYINNKEIPVKIEYNENNSVKSLLSKVNELMNNVQEGNYIFDNDLLHAYSIFNKTN